jgi:hypothetical protein
MTSAALLPAAVLNRKAVVYIRQSTQAQAQTNLQSQRRQYNLVDVARPQRFHDIEVIDDDLGRSASGMVARRPPQTFSISSICAPSGAATQHTCRPLLTRSSRICAPFFLTFARAPA